MFHETSTEHLETWTSDHNPVLVFVEEKAEVKSTVKELSQGSIMKTCGAHTISVKKSFNLNGWTTAIGIIKIRLLSLKRQQKTYWLNYNYGARKSLEVERKS